MSPDQHTKTRRKVLGGGNIARNGSGSRQTTFLAVGNATIERTTAICPDARPCTGCAPEVATWKPRRKSFNRKCTETRSTCMVLETCQILIATSGPNRIEKGCVVPGHPVAAALRHCSDSALYSLRRSLLAELILKTQCVCMQAIRSYVSNLGLC